MISKRAILLALATAVMLAGTSLVSAQVVTVWTFLDPAKPTGRDLALKVVIEKFETANPGVKIKVESQIFSELGAKFLMGHKTGTAPDVIFINIENIGSLVKAGALADLQKAAIEKWPTGQDADFFMRAGWDAAKVGNARFAVPLFAGTPTIFYRKDLFKQAGIDPSSIKTWDALTQAAQKLTKDTNGDGTTDVWGFMAPLSPERGGGVTAVVPMIQSAKEVLWDSKTCQPRYNTEAGKRALQMHADWINVQKVMTKEALASNSDDVMEQFTAGRFAMAVGALARFENTARAATWNGNENLGVLPWPTWDGATTGPQSVTGWYLGVWKNSKKLDVAAKFVDSMISEESVRTWSTTGGQVPTRSSVFKDAEFRKTKYEYVRQMQTAWSTWSVIAPTNCNMARFDADLNSAVQRVVLKQSDPAKALAEAEKKFTERQ